MSSIPWEAIVGLVGIVIAIIGGIIKYFINIRKQIEIRLTQNEKAIIDLKHKMETLTILLEPLKHIEKIVTDIAIIKDKSLGCMAYHAMLDKHETDIEILKRTKTNYK